MLTLLSTIRYGRNFRLFGLCFPLAILLVTLAAQYSEVAAQHQFDGPGTYHDGRLVSEYFWANIAAGQRYLDAVARFHEAQDSGQRMDFEDIPHLSDFGYRCPDDIGNCATKWIPGPDSVSGLSNPSSYSQSGSMSILDRPGMLIVMPAAAPAQQCGIITTGHLKLRWGPSIDDEVIGYVPRGTRLFPIKRKEYWVNVEYQEESGWIGAAYVSDDCGDTVTRASAAAEDTICATGNLRVRAGPSLDTDTIGFVRKGATLRAVSRKRFWFNINYKGDSGWIGAAHVDDECRRAVAVKPAAREGSDRICTTGKLRVRAGPSLDAETIGFVRSGVKLSVVSRVGSWLRFDFRGEMGWIGAGYVRDNGDCN